MKKIRNKILYFLLLGLNLQTCASQLYDKQILMEQAISIKDTYDIEENSVVINEPLFPVLLENTINHAVALSQEEQLSDGLLRCWELSSQGKNRFSLGDIHEALPDLLAYFISYTEQEKAPRPDAPGNTDGAPVGTLLECDFSELLSLIKRIANSVSQCCGILQQDFFYTWTILADIESTLTTCCADIQVDFNGVFTSINAIDMDFNSIFTAITNVENTLTACCAAIEGNFEGTFTSLTDIRNSLTTCCADIQVDFNSVFTSINAIDVDSSSIFTAITDLQDTLTACCESIEGNFEATFTSISNLRDTLTACCSQIQIDFNGVFTALVVVNPDLSNVFTVLTSINNTLTTCCATIQANFNDVLSVLVPCCSARSEQLDSLVEANSVTVITQANIDDAEGPFIINNPGNFILSQDVISESAESAIVINASHVTLDLRGRVIEGKGILQNAIQVNPGLRDITIKNGSINAVQLDAIHVLNGVTGLKIDSINISNAGRSGINLDGSEGDSLPIRNGFIKKCHVVLSATAQEGQAIGGLALTNCESITVNKCIFNRNGSPQVTTIAGVLLTDCSNCHLKNVSAYENCAMMDVYGCAAKAGNRNCFVKCTSSKNFSLKGSACGFALGEQECSSSVIHCRADGNSTHSAHLTSPTESVVGTGIFIDGAHGASCNTITKNMVTHNSDLGIFDNNCKNNGVASESLNAESESNTHIAQNYVINNGDISIVHDAQEESFPDYLVRYSDLPTTQSPKIKHSSLSHLNPRTLVDKVIRSIRSYL